MGPSMNAVFSYNKIHTNWTKHGLCARIHAGSAPSSYVLTAEELMWSACSVEMLQSSFSRSRSPCKAPSRDISGSPAVPRALQTFCCNASQFRYCTHHADERDGPPSQQETIALDGRQLVWRHTTYNAALAVAASHQTCLEAAGIRTEAFEVQHCLILSASSVNIARCRTVVSLFTLLLLHLPASVLAFVTSLYYCCLGHGHTSSLPMAFPPWTRIHYYLS